MTLFAYGCYFEFGIVILRYLCVVVLFCLGLCIVFWFFGIVFWFYFVLVCFGFGLGW